MLVRETEGLKTETDCWGNTERQREVTVTDRLDKSSKAICQGNSSRQSSVFRVEPKQNNKRRACLISEALICFALQLSAAATCLISSVITHLNPDIEVTGIGINVCQRTNHIFLPNTNLTVLSNQRIFNCLPEMTDVFKLLEIRFILKEQTFIRQWKFNNCGAFSVVFPQVAVP